MGERLSSRGTFFYKFIFSNLWIGFGPLIIFIHADARPEWPIFFMGWLIFSVIIYRTCCRLKRVERQGNILSISNYFQQTEVPLSDVESVSGTILGNPEFIWIKFRQPTIFGSKIIFMPKMRFFSLHFDRHPLVAQLNEEIMKLRT